MPTRKELIANRQCGPLFIVNDNPKASGSAPIYEFSAFSQVNRYNAIIDKVASEVGVDGRLIRAIMYMETTHGYYDAPLSWFDANKSILPMNVNTQYWGDAFGSRESLKDPYNNIKAGAEILFGIKSNLPTGASIAQIATLYNNINASSTTDYGSRVEDIYTSQPWQTPPKQSK